MWNEIKTEDDIKELMREYCGFHDSCIVSINYSSRAYVDENNAMGNGEPDEHIILMTLNSQMRQPLELLFKGVRKCSIVGWEEDYFCDIYGAYIGFNKGLLGKTRDDNLIIWSDYEDFDPKNYREEELISKSGHNCTYVIAQRLFWRYNTIAPPTDS